MEALNNDEQQQRQNLNLTDATLEIKGNTGGREVTVTGDIENVWLLVSTARDWRNSNMHLAPNVNYQLAFKTQPDGKQLTIKKSQHDIEHVARIEVKTRTAASVEAARKLAGAPEDAQFVFVYDYKRDELSHNPGGMVEFSWTEKK